LGIGFRGQLFFIVWGAGFGGIPLAMSVVFSRAFGFSPVILPIWAAVMLMVGIFFGKKMQKFMKVSGARHVGGNVGGGFGSSSFSDSGSFSGGSSFSDFGGGSSGGGGASSSW
jgi:uncharacterized membrane protein YgcG